ncbi:hypothetical protein K4K61_001963 [Colletotrichum sp. SAR11_59]|nr:hypothetical protein K4K61_001963 [Colletotrichum sp. SAR11_59]
MCVGLLEYRDLCSTPRGLLAAWCQSFNNFVAVNLLDPHNATETLDASTGYELVIAVGNSNLAAQLTDRGTEIVVELPFAEAMSQSSKFRDVGVTSVAHNDAMADRTDA